MNKNLIIGASIALVVAIAGFIIFKSLGGANGPSSELKESTKTFLKRQQESKFLLPLDFAVHPVMEAAIESGDADKIQDAKQKLAQVINGANVDIAYEFYKSDYQIYAKVKKWKDSLASSEDDLSLALYANILLGGLSEGKSHASLDSVLSRLEEKAPDNPLAQLAIIRACLKDNKYCSHAESIDKNVRDSKLKAGLAVHFYRAGDQAKALELLKGAVNSGVSKALESNMFEALDSVLLGQDERTYLHYFHYSSLVLSNRDSIYNAVADMCTTNYSNKDWQKVCYDFGWKLFDAGERKGKELATSGMQYLSAAQRSIGMKRLETIQARQNKGLQASKVCAVFIKERKNPIISDFSWRFFLSKLNKLGYQAANGNLCSTLK